MEKQNFFTSKFKNKTSEELRKIVDDNKFQKDAKLAAIWELESRDELSDEEEEMREKINTEEENRVASTLANQRYETFWQRFFAAIIDGLVMWPIGFGLKYLLGSDIGYVVIIGQLLNSFSPYLYSVLFHGFKGQTLGKMAMGVIVVDFETEGEIDLKQAFLRDSVPIVLMVGVYIYSLIMFVGNLENAGFVAFAPLFFIAILNFIWVSLEIFSMLFNDKSRAVHDLIAKTVVVRSE